MTGEAGRTDTEADVIARLAAVGLVVPTRDPERPHTKTESRCFKTGVIGFPKEGGKAWSGRHPCKSSGCPACADRWAEVEMSGIRRAYEDFVPIDPVYGEALLLYRAKRDKVSEGSLWLAGVPTPPDTPRAVKERMKVRARRFDQPVTRIVIPCDDLAVVVSTADLAQGRGRGRPFDAPRSGFWLPPAVAFLYLREVLSSRAVCGRLDWPELWKPVEPTKREAYTVTGEAHIMKTAGRILLSEGYRWVPGQSGWFQDDPMDILLTAKRRAAAFWANPACSNCADFIRTRDKHWWDDGKPFCEPCQLGNYLQPLMTRGRTEREIERHLRPGKLTFARNRMLIEEALSRVGAQKARSGIWVPRDQREETG